MKFAPIVPYAYLDLIRDRDYHLILPACVKESEPYASAYGMAKGFKILDNGAAEGTLSSPDELFEVAKLMNVHEIVVPDVLSDWRATVQMVEEFGELAQKHPKYSYMAVVQGSAMHEIMSCFYYYQTCPWITRVAFPRHWINIHRGLRASMAESLIAQLHDSFPNGVHALGANNFLLEPIMLSSIPNGNPIVGMDTSLPASAALAGEAIDQVLDTTPRQDGFFQAPYDEITYAIMEHNIRMYDQWCRNTHKSPSVESIDPEV